MSERKVRTDRKTPFLECELGKIAVDKDGILGKVLKGPGTKEEIENYYLNVIKNVRVVN